DASGIYAQSNGGTVAVTINSGTVSGGSGSGAGVVIGSGPSANNMLVNLGAGNALTNAGTLSPGGAGSIQTTALTGNLVQTPTGQLAIDFNMAGGSADRVNVSGTANLAGAVRMQVL